jgi:4'-phosphopantetheinyl transferase
MAPAGKPILADGEPGSVTFNLSHAGDWVLLAFGFGASVGVDVEYVTGFRDLEEVAARVLTGGELAELRALPSEARVEPFYRAWTRKEALLKALGTGLTEAASQLPTGVGAPGPWGGSEVMVRPRGSDGEWTVVSLDAPEGYCAAVAKEGAPLKIRSTGTRKIWNS